MGTQRERERGRERERDSVWVRGGRLGNENVCFPIGKLKNLRLGNENICFPIGKLKNLKNLKSEHRSKPWQTDAGQPQDLWLKDVEG